MKGLLQHFQISLRLHFRNRMALLYGYLFPLIFLLAFWVLYRYDRIPLVDHMGAVLTISILGGACFGLPTTMVSEREAGTWRRFRTAPVPTWTFVVSTALSRYLLLASAGLLQLAAAVALGMPGPEHPFSLWVAFTLASFAFIGIGLVIAMLADSVPAVQALGQCVFLPMLIIGGVAVPLFSLPEWAQRVSAFFPGRYAVDALQDAVISGEASAADTRFNLLALALIGLAGCVAGAALFRWETHQRWLARANKLGLALAVTTWLLLGFTACEYDRLSASDGMAALFAPTRPAGAPQSWEAITSRDVAALDFNVPPDYSRVSPIAGDAEKPGPEMAVLLEGFRTKLPDWPPGHDQDDVQSVRNLVSIVAVADAAISPTERFLPRIILPHLSSRYPKDKLVKILTWIALHPNEGTVVDELSALGLEVSVARPMVVQQRNRLYATKFIMRLTGRAVPWSGQPAPKH